MLEIAVWHRDNNNRKIMRIARQLSYQLISILLLSASLITTLGSLFGLLCWDNETE